MTFKLKSGQLIYTGDTGLVLVFNLHNEDNTDQLSFLWLHEPTHGTGGPSSTPSLDASLKEGSDCPYSWWRLVAELDWKYIEERLLEGIFLHDH